MAPFTGGQAISAIASMAVYQRLNVLSLLATPRVAPCVFLLGKDDTCSTGGLR